MDKWKIALATLVLVAFTLPMFAYMPVAVADDGDDSAARPMCWPFYCDIEVEPDEVYVGETYTVYWKKGIGTGHVGVDYPNGTSEELQKTRWWFQKGSFNVTAEEPGTYNYWIETCFPCWGWCIIYCYDNDTIIVLVPPTPPPPTPPEGCWGKGAVVGVPSRLAYKACISGHVYKAGEPRQGMEVILYVATANGWSELARDITDANGFYEFCGLHMGSYLVVCDGVEHWVHLGVCETATIDFQLS